MVGLGRGRYDGPWPHCTFVVSATRTKDGVESVMVQSLAGEVCRMANPWPGSEMKVTCMETGEKIGIRDSGICEFATAREKSYRILP